MGQAEVCIVTFNSSYIPQKVKGIVSSRYSMIPYGLEKIKSVHSTGPFMLSDFFTS
jgi:hypothetical protein